MTTHDTTPMIGFSASLHRCQKDNWIVLRLSVLQKIEGCFKFEFSILSPEKDDFKFESGILMTTERAERVQMPHDMVGDKIGVVVEKKITILEPHCLIELNMDNLLCD